MGMLSEFKAFAMRGNVMDLAVGVVIGAAFGKIVTSLVDQIIMPPIGVLIGGVISFARNKRWLEAIVLAAAAVLAIGIYGGVKGEHPLEHEGGEGEHASALVQTGTPNYSTGRSLGETDAS